MFLYTTNMYRISHTNIKITVVIVKPQLMLFNYEF